MYYEIYHSKCLIPIDCFTGVQDSGYLNIGQPTYICQKCGAMMWYKERTRKHYNARVPEFSMCCLKGKVVIAPYPRLLLGKY